MSDFCVPTAMDDGIVRMGEAADTGNTDGIYVVLQECPHLLERIDGLPFAQTPLHIAVEKIAAEQNLDAEERYIKFALEMMNLTPSFARKLNPADGYSPMHITVVGGQTQVVRNLLRFDRDLARVKGRSGLTPLHLAAEKGNMDILDTLLWACPECITDVDVNGLNALHIAADHNMFKALQFMAYWIRKSTHKDGRAWEMKVINGKDRQGNTLLHKAASKNNPQMLELLLKCNVLQNATNWDGETALDIAQGHNLSVDVLLLAKYRRASANRSGSALAQSSRSQDILWWQKVRRDVCRLHKNFSNEPPRGALLVVYALIVTSTFQVCLSPPGGLTQINNSGYVARGNSTGNFTQGNNTDSRNISSTQDPLVDFLILNPGSFNTFYFLNTVTFLMAVFVMLILLGREMKAFALYIPIFFLICCYMTTMFDISPNIFACLMFFLDGLFFSFGVMALAATVW